MTAPSRNHLDDEQHDKRTRSSSGGDQKFANDDDDGCCSDLNQSLRAELPITSSQGHRQLPASQRPIGQIISNNLRGEQIKFFFINASEAIDQNLIEFLPSSG